MPLPTNLGALRHIVVVPSLSSLPLVHSGRSPVHVSDLLTRTDTRCFLGTKDGEVGGGQTGGSGRGDDDGIKGSGN